MALDTKSSAEREKLRLSIRRENLQLLRDWLSRPGWRIDEAAWLLTGVCPETSPGWIGCREPTPFHPLPGMEKLVPGNPDDPAFSFDCCWVEDRISFIRGMLIAVTPGGAEGIETPSKILERSLKGQFLPPWLDAARDDPECNSLLPKYFLNVISTEKLNRSDAAKQGWSKTPKRQKLLDTGGEVFRDLKDNGFKGYWKHPTRREIPTDLNIEVLSKKIRDSLLEDHPEIFDQNYALQTVRNQVNKWLRE